MCVLFSVRRLLLVASLSSVAITGFEDLKLWSPPQADDSWKVPIRVVSIKLVPSDDLP